MTMCTGIVVHCCDWILKWNTDFRCDPSTLFCAERTCLPDQTIPVLISALAKYIQITEIPYRLQS